ncbi:MAG: selenide, water dikinase SelD [Fibrobacterota bacterium]
MNTNIKLTRTVAAAGCAAKLDPGILADLLGSVDVPVNGNLLVGIEKFDDAGVYKLTDDIALVQTLDFFTPIVDDPFLFGMIAATNALSDVYAMGGEPLTAMNIVCFPSATMDKSVLAEIVKGGIEKIREAGAVLAGGHSIMDTEVKYGLSVTGQVHPLKIWKNSTARVGDKAILTKPLGCGVLSTALKQEKINEAEAREAFASMALLNKSAKRIIEKYRVRACTDVTGFSLMGHGLEMAEGSGLCLRIDASAVPVMDGVLELIRAGAVPGGTRRNMKYYQPRTSIPASLALPLEILFDPQTSGGLLAALAPEDAEACVRELRAAGLAKAAMVGEFFGRAEKALILR